MFRTNGKIFAAALVITGLLTACAEAPKRYTVPDRHPEALGAGRTNCLDCHDPSDSTVAFADLVHTPDWMSIHRSRVYQNEQVCALCHTQAYCNDCHVTRSELKPSIKNQAEPYQRTPHRGDYLSRHRIDARLDPTSCFRCHGNPKAAKTCAPCHG